MSILERIHKFDQLKLIADPRRLSIMRHLMDAPATLSQLGKALGEHPAWIRHHLKLLEQADLVELDEVRISGGFIEKYYRSKAQAYLFQELFLPGSSGKPSVVLCGSHDMALELLSRTQVGEADIIMLSVGSLDGLVALREGMCSATGCHLYDTSSGDYNTPYVRHFFPDREMVLLTLAHREQGLIIPAGNPDNIRGLEDLARPNMLMINRKRGSGTRLWLDEQLKRMGILPGQVPGYADEASTHTQVALAIQQGHARVGLGIHAAAIAMGLGFIPLFNERYDLVIPREQIKQKHLAPMLDAFNSSKFRHQVESLGGYDTSHLGDQILV